MSRFMILEALWLSASLSLDALMASFAYGSAKIKIPFLSVQIINVVCCAVLGVSLLIGAAIRPYLPARLTTAICVGILLVSGLIKLLDGAAKSVIRKYNNFKKELRFSMFSVKFILSLYADPEEADVDASRVISPAEAVSLALALSLDGLAVGFGAALGDINVPAVIIGSLAANTAAVTLGCLIGNRLARNIRFNFSWVSGAILIALALTKLF